VTSISNNCGELHTCLLTAHTRRQQGALAGAYIPQCDAEDGSFSAVQCHTSTGYCWCSSRDGAEIANTRVRGVPTCPQ
jgi:hypothetical protein